MTAVAQALEQMRRESFRRGQVSAALPDAVLAVILVMAIVGALTL